MSFFFFVPVEVRQTPQPTPISIRIPPPTPISIRIPPPTMCDYCKLRPRNSGYNYCSRDCGRKHKRALRPMCKNCHCRPVMTGYQYCSHECGRVHVKRNICPGCRAFASNHIYEPYCSFECRRIHEYHTRRHF
ncbi:hypothetical protein QJ857_gp0108 [Tupanvirus soda lake]|uniref:Uncharacterized protein n=2 Tax=Tupanvirus TaxID=2094720 RepID=A0A6N1NNS5_9VIRU|nr:hypothetical protein QJ857_gp0108 [Tupanvirus soda lake]QKU35915.1 hypothetical protein [Tupanvirus soda lake]